MNPDQLKHAIRAACDVSEDDELYIFGSQAILGQYPEADEKLRRSIEVDVCPVNKPQAVDKIDGALGEMSQFHQTHGFYVHGVSIESAILPEGWKGRTFLIRDYINTTKRGYCVEAHDLAASKLMAFRPKDIGFVRLLIINKLVDTPLLIRRLKETSADGQLIERAVNWVRKITNELASGS